MPRLRIPASSDIYVKQRVRFFESGTEQDPTADTVEVQFTATDADPTSSGWTTGSWETDATVTPNRYYARVLVGPSGITLTAGTWRMWIRVTDSPEVPVLEGDIVQVT